MGKKNAKIRTSYDSGYQSRAITPSTSSQRSKSDDSSEEGGVQDIPSLTLRADEKHGFPHADDENAIFEAIEPPVPPMEKLRFYGWCAAVAAGQCAKDVKALQLPSALFSRDLISHFVMVPVAKAEPRLLASGPGAHIELYRLQDVDAYHSGKLRSLQGRPTLQLINLASNNYGGFAQLEPGALELQQAALRKLPMTPAPPALENALREEFKKFMGFAACEITSSGFSCNMLAFRAAAVAAAAQNRRCVFLMDRESRKYCLLLFASYGYPISHTSNTLGLVGCPVDLSYSTVLLGNGPWFALFHFPASEHSCRGEVP